MTPKRIGYMCYTDFIDELGNAPGANCVYGTIEELVEEKNVLRVVELLR